MLSQNEYKKREYEMLGERRTLKFYTGWPGKLSLRTRNMNKDVKEVKEPAILLMFRKHYTQIKWHG